MSRTADPTSTPRNRAWDLASVGLDVAVLGMAAWAFLQALDFRPLAGYAPLTAAGIILVLLGVQTVIDTVKLLRRQPLVVVGERSPAGVRFGGRGLVLAVRYLAWFVGFFAVMFAFGVLVAAGAFMSLFLRLEARWGWAGVALATVAAVVVAGAMISLLELRAPRAQWPIGYDWL